MKRADYKCKMCMEITEVIIEDTGTFPDKIKCTICGGGSFRLFAPLHSIVHQGVCGNSKNGYKSNAGYVKKT